jgi:hypothetical protein
LFYCSPPSRTTSNTWKAIYKAFICLRDGFAFKLGKKYVSLWFDHWLNAGIVGSLVDYVYISDSNLKVNDLWVNGYWNFSHLMTNLPNDIRNLVTAVPIPSYRRSDDSIIWLSNITRIYNPKSAYLWLLKSYVTLNSDRHWFWIWKLKIPEKVQLMIWQIWHDCLPTNSLHFKQHLTSSSTCYCCNKEEEDILHCLRDCVHVKNVWETLSFVYLGDFWSAEVKVWCQNFILSNATTIFLSAIWWL